MTEEIESQAAFGRRIGVNQARVSQLVAQGMPAGPDGKGIPIAEALAWVEQNLDPERRQRGKESSRGTAKKMKADAQQGPKLTDLQRLLLAEKVRMARLRFDEAKGVLIDREMARQSIMDRAIFVRDAMLSWVGPTAATLAAESGGDQRRIQAALDRLLRQKLTEIADTRHDGVLSDA